MSNSIQNNNFVQTITNLDLNTQHLSANLNAVAKPGFFSRLFTMIFGGNAQEKITVAGKINDFITANKARLVIWSKSSNPNEKAQFEAFKAKLDALNGKLKRNIKLDKIVDFAASINNLQVPQNNQNRAPIPKKKPSTVVPPSVPAAASTVVPPLSVPVAASKVDVSSKATKRELVKGDPQLRRKEEMDLKPKVREASAEQVMAAFGDQAVKRLIQSYGEPIALKVFAHFNEEILAGKKYHGENSQLRIFKMANHFVLEALPKQSRQETLDLFFNTRFSGDFAAEFKSGHNKLSGTNTFAKLQSFCKILPQAKIAIGTKVISNLLKNFGWDLTNEIFKEFKSAISAGKSLEEVRVYAFANARLLDVYIARSLPNGMSKEKALAILTGKPEHEINADFLKEFRRGEITINSLDVPNLKKVLIKPARSNDSSAA